MAVDPALKVHRSPGFITSNLTGKREDGALIKEFEASHGTVADLWHAHMRGEDPMHTATIWRHHVLSIRVYILVAMSFVLVSYRYSSASGWHQQLSCAPPPLAQCVLLCSVNSERHVSNSLHADE
eukprot:3833831-Amphidinium_carterae.1